MWRRAGSGVMRCDIMTMTIDEIKRRVEQIISVSRGDDEMAHTLEDRLHRDVLTAIATFNCGSPHECAKEALRTMDINFSRYCA